MKKIKDFNLTVWNKIDYFILMFYIVEIKHKEKVEHEISIQA